MIVQAVLEALASNTIVAALIAACALLARRFGARAALVHCLWLLVLVKLLTPPLLSVSVPIGSAAEPAAAAPPPAGVQREDACQSLSFKPHDGTRTYEVLIGTDLQKG